MRAIIGIDPGASGAISIFSNARVASAKMPTEVLQMKEYLTFLKETYPDAIVFIEKVQAWVSDDDTAGKKFGINKLLKNYNELLTVIKVVGIPVVEVAPISWQSALGLRGEKGDSKADRKSKYKDFAQRQFPQLKVNLATADSLCLVVFAEFKMKNDPLWVSDKLGKAKPGELF